MTAWSVVAALALLGGLALFRGQAISLFMKVFGFSIHFETRHRQRPHATRRDIGGQVPAVDRANSND